MDKETFLQTIANIGTCENEIERRELLAEMSEQVESIFDANEQLSSKNDELVSDNEGLRAANMKLFLRIGESKTHDEQIIDKTGIKPEPEKRKFEDLFNDKGGIR